MFSQEYGDIYFSAEDGLAETQHVFLAGNNLPEAWKERPRFCICETGFGTGLNFLAAWKMFEETASDGQRLDYVSIEKFPLTPQQIREALEPWRHDLGVYLDVLLKSYPIRVRGFHRVALSARVTLTLVFDDVRAALPQMQASVDAWFLDGFAPAKNPDMWEEGLYSKMARLSHAQTSFASFTAAGLVRRGLEANGFDVHKQKGFGRKRDMIAGRFAAGKAKAQNRPIKSVAVVGAGIAGLSAAWHLRRAGFDVCVYEAAGQAGTLASGNRLGIVNPKLTARDSPTAQYYTAAYAYALRTLTQFDGIDFNATGALHLEVNPDKARRFEGYLQNLGWHADHMRILEAQAASAVAGVPVPVPCLHYPDAASVSPAKLCVVLAGQVEVVYNTRIETLEQIEADAVVLANADDAARFTDVPLSRVRGQVSLLRPNDISRHLQCNLSYGGYISPVMAEGLHMCGATFQPWGTLPDVLPEDHAHNLAMLTEALPVFAGGFEVTGGRTGFRCASRDRIPVVGQADGVYLSTAHGSHGIISGLMAGAILAESLSGGVMPLGISALATVAPGRFHKG